MSEVSNTIWMTKKEAAAHLRCSTVTIDKNRKTGKIIGKKMGKKVLFNRADLDAFVNQN